MNKVLNTVNVVFFVLTSPQFLLLIGKCLSSQVCQALTQSPMFPFAYSDKQVSSCFIYVDGTKAKLRIIADN